MFVSSVRREIPQRIAPSLRQSPYSSPPACSGITAIRAVLPPELPVAAVGGISDKDFGSYVKAGIRVFGLGSSLYKPGMTAGDVAERAKAAIRAYDLVTQDLPEVMLSRMIRAGSNSDCRASRDNIADA